MAYEIVPRLVRGLDYYTRTTFEITSGRWARKTLCWAEAVTTACRKCWEGRRRPAFGFAIGQDRLVLTVEESAALELKRAARRLRGLDGRGRARTRHAPGAPIAPGRHQRGNQLPAGETEKSHGPWPTNCGLGTPSSSVKKRLQAGSIN